MSTEFNVAAVEPAKPEFGHQSDGSYLTPFNTTFFYRDDFFQSCLAGLIDRSQNIILPESVDWTTLHEMPQFITPHVVIFDDVTTSRVDLSALVGFYTRGFQRVIVYSDRIDTYAQDYVELVAANPAAAKIITVNNVDLFYDTFITTGSAFTVMLIEDLLRERYGKRMDIDADDLEETKYLMRGIKFGRSPQEAVERFLEIAAAGYRIGEKRTCAVIRGQALEDSLHYYAKQIAQTAMPRGNVLLVWINAFLLKSLRKPLLEALIMRNADSDVDFDFALCLHPINDKIAVTVLTLGTKVIPPFDGKETDSAILTPAQLSTWWPGIIVPAMVVQSGEVTPEVTPEVAREVAAEVAGEVAAETTDTIDLRGSTTIGTDATTGN